MPLVAPLVAVVMDFHMVFQRAQSYMEKMRSQILDTFRLGYMTAATNRQLLPRQLVVIEVL